MENYSLLADLLTTFRSSSDLVKIVSLLSVGLFVLALAQALRVGLGSLALVLFPLASGLRRRTLPPSGDVLPGWMAGAERIVIVAHKREGQITLREYTPDGNTPTLLRQVPGGGSSGPAFQMPDGGNGNGIKH